MQILTFQKSGIDQKWYFRYPDYNGPHSDLEMIEGAEQLLTIESENLNVVQFKVSTLPFEGTTMVFKKIKETPEEKGAEYQLYHHDYATHQVWFCAVLEQLYGHFPETLYVQPIDLVERIQNIQSGFFHAANHFEIDPDATEREWKLLEDTKVES